jgi:hypothetical protein
VNPDVCAGSEPDKKVNPPNGAFRTTTLQVWMGIILLKSLGMKIVNPGGISKHFPRYGPAQAPLN